MNDKKYENIISKEDIHTYGLKARQKHSPIRGNCGKIVDSFEGFLIDNCNLPYTGDFVDEYGVRHVRVGPNGEEKHFIFQINGHFVQEFADFETIWIDLSFDQFNNSNKKQDYVQVSYGKKDSIDKIKIIITNQLPSNTPYSIIGDRLFNN